MNKSSIGTSTSGSEQGNNGTKEPLVDQAKHAVTHVADQAKEQVTSQLTTQFDARKDKAVETIGSVAEAIRGTSDKLKGVGPLGDVAGRAADGIDKFGKFFENKDIGQILQEANRFARREPAIFLGTAFVIGLIGGRFLKSSSRPAVASPSAYAQGGGYQPSYGASSYDDTSSFLSDEELERDVQSSRSSTYESHMRPAPQTQPMRSGATQGSKAGSSFQSGNTSGGGATQGGIGGPAPKGGPTARIGTATGSAIGTGTLGETGSLGSSGAGVSNGMGAPSGSATTKPTKTGAV